MADTILSDSVSKDDSGHTHVALQSIHLSNLLSFGPDTPPLPLRLLNILIGANGSGKSNLIDAISLLRSCAGDIQSTLRRGGGVLEWVWKGNPQKTASIEAVVGNPEYTQDIRHKIEFSAQQQIVQIVDESIENTTPYEGNSDTYFYYRYQKGHPVTNVSLDVGGRRLRHEEKIVGNQSILNQRTDTTTYPEIAHISNQYNAFRIYR